MRIKIQKSNRKTKLLTLDGNKSKIKKNKIEKDPNNKKKNTEVK